MKKKENRGRKPVSDKKVTVSVYPRSSEVKKAGGLLIAKAKALKAILNEKRPE